MKLAYLANSRFPSERAHTTQMFHNVNAFSAAGYEVTLYVTNRATGIDATAAEYYGAPFLGSLERIKVPDLASWGAVLPRFLHRPTLTIQRLVFAWRAARSITNAEVIYSRDEWVLWFFSQFSAVGQLVYESHEAKFTWPVRRLLARGVPCVAISEGIRDRYTTLGVPAAQILVAHDGIDDSFFAPTITKAEAQAKLSITSSKPVVLYFGGLAAWKGVDTLCAAAEDQDQFNLFICGGSKEEIARLQAQYPATTFLGFTAYRDLPQLQQAADVLVIPNSAKSDLSASYTSPLKVFAFMAAGKPLVVSDIPSLRAVLDESMARFAVPDNPDSFRQRILETLTAKDTAQAQVATARAKAEQYRWSARAIAIRDFITAATGSSR